MVTAISFRANETAGGVGEKTVETAKKETAGGVGVRRNNNDSIFSVDNQPAQDTVSFKAAQTGREKTSAGSFILGLTALTALLIGGLGLAHKYDVVSKIKNDKVKDFFRHTDAVTEPCHKACKWIKNNSYDKIVKMFKK